MLDLVDLAGSERLRISNAKGARLEECKHINQSLSALSKVISSLSENPKRKHVSYRDSKLTRLLKESLGGNSKTSLIACISPSQDSFSETLSTLHFACKAKLVRNQMVKNCEIRKVVNSQKGRPELPLSKFPKKLETVREERQSEQSARMEAKEGFQKNNADSAYFSRNKNELNSQREVWENELEEQSQLVKRLEKKNRNMKERLKICEREREIALNALQQQTEHLNIEKAKRKKLEEDVEQMEMMLDLKKSTKNDNQEDEGTF